MTLSKAAMGFFVRPMSPHWVPGKAQLWCHAEVVHLLLISAGIQRWKPCGKHFSESTDFNKAGWWLLLTPLKNDGLKVSWDDDIPNMHGKVIKAMFQTTNQMGMLWNILGISWEHYAKNYERIFWKSYLGSVFWKSMGCCWKGSHHIPSLVPINSMDVGFLEFNQPSIHLDLGNFCHRTKAHPWKVGRNMWWTPHDLQTLMLLHCLA